MDNLPRHWIVQLMQDTSLSDSTAAARAAAAALAGWAEAASNPQMARVDALESLYEMSQTLEQAQAALAATLPEIVRRAAPGKTLQERLAEGQYALGQGAAEVMRLKAEIEPLQQDEQALHLQAGEISSLQQRLEQLQHISALAAHAAALRQQVEALTQRLPPEAQEAGGLEERIDALSSRLIVLEDAALARLREQIRQGLTLAGQRETELRQAAQDLQSARQRYQKAEAALTPEHRQVLGLYQQADASVTRALPGAEAVRIEELVQSIEKMLTQADDALRLAVEANEKASRLTPLPYAGA